jgi:hypothetical protein
LFFLNKEAEIIVFAFLNGRSKRRTSFEAPIRIPPLHDFVHRTIQDIPVAAGGPQSQGIYLNSTFEG